VTVTSSSSTFGSGAGLGIPSDGFVSGLYYEGQATAGTSYTISFQLQAKGNTGIAWDKLAFQIINSRGYTNDNAQDNNPNGTRLDTLANECSTGALDFAASGIASAESESISGSLGVYGLLKPVELRTATAQYGLHGAVVSLIDSEDDTVAHTLTDMNGDFSFSVSNCSAGYKIKIEADGVLQEDLKLHEYLFPAAFEAGSLFGSAVAASCTGNELKLYIDAVRTLDGIHSYDREYGRQDRTTANPTLDFGSFVGTGHTPRFWAAQFDRMSGGVQLRVDKSLLMLGRKLAQEYLAGCDFAASESMMVDTLSTGSDAEKALVAAALSHFTEGGVLANFRTVQENVLLPYARFRICEAPVAGDRALEFANQVVESY